MTEQVYFYEATRLGMVKIGRARNVVSRRRQWQAGTPSPLVLLGSVRGGHALESQLHRQFEDVREYGEWFRLTDDVRVRLLAIIGSAAAQPEDAERAEFRAIRISSRTRAKLDSLRRTMSVDLNRPVTIVSIIRAALIDYETHITALEGAKGIDT